MTPTVTETARLFCSFRLDGRLFGIDALDVKEVTTETQFTQIAHAPDEVLGLVNIRGHIYLVLDLRRLLGMPPADLSENTRLILFKPSTGNAFGVVVDSISEIRSIKSDQIEPFSDSARESSVPNLNRNELITAVCKLPDELLVLLNPKRFLTVVERQFDEHN